MLRALREQRQFAACVCFAAAYATRKVAGRERRHEEATRTAPEPAEPYGPRRCGGPEHTAGLSKSGGQRTSHNGRKWSIDLFQASPKSFRSQPYKWWI